VIEHDAVAGVEAVALAVVDGHPIGEDLAHRVGAAGVEGSLFGLGVLLGQAEHLRGGGLVVAGVDVQLAHALQNTQRAHGHGVAGVLGHVEAHLDVALGSQVVYLGGLHLHQDLVDAAGVGEVAVDQAQAGSLGLGRLVEMVDASGVEGAAAADDAPDLVALGQEQFGQIGPILAGDAGDKRAFVHDSSPPWV